MSQDSWQHQGRQQHGWFGHGTGPDDDSPKPSRPVGPDNPPAHESIDHRATSVAYGVMGHLSTRDGRNYESRLENGMLADYRKVVAAHPATAHLDDRTYGEHVLGNHLQPGEVGQLRQASALIHGARTLDDLGPPTTALAAVVKSAGLTTMARRSTPAPTPNRSGSGSRGFPQEASSPQRPSGPQR